MIIEFPTSFCKLFFVLGSNESSFKLLVKSHEITGCDGCCKKRSYTLMF